MQIKKKILVIILVIISIFLCGNFSICEAYSRVNYLDVRGTDYEFEISSITTLGILMRFESK